MTDEALKFRRVVIAADPPGSLHDITLIGDINGDGRPEIVIGGKKGPPNLFWYENPSWRRHDMADAPNLEAGGYYVVYDDGYTSWSPAEVFEDGYEEISCADPPTTEQGSVAALLVSLGADPHFRETNRKLFVAAVVEAIATPKILRKAMAIKTAVDAMAGLKE